MDPIATLVAALDRAGMNQAQLARRIGKKPGHVWAWINRDREVPANMCRDVVRALDGHIQLHELRPDLWTPAMSAAEEAATQS